MFPGPRKSAGPCLPEPEELVGSRLSPTSDLSDPAWQAEGVGGCRSESKGWHMLFQILALCSTMVVPKVT